MSNQEGPGMTVTSWLHTVCAVLWIKFHTYVYYTSMPDYTRTAVPRIAEAALLPASITVAGANSQPDLQLQHLAARQKQE